MIDFNELVDKHLHRELRPKQLGRYYPSEIGFCMRKTWYSYKFPQETTADLVKIFQAGNMIHNFVADVLKSEKTPEVELLQSEVPFRENIKDFVVSGRADDLLIVKADNKKVLVEVKSTSMIKCVDGPSDLHELQLQIYMHFLGIQNGLILYIEKNTLQSKVFEVEYDKDKVEKTLKRFDILHEKLKNDTLPAAEAKKDKNKEWMCKYCEYEERCGKQ
jgi:CRISPR-associated exonuclease Cas4